MCEMCVWLVCSVCSVVCVVRICSVCGISVVCMVCACNVCVHVCMCEMCVSGLCVVLCAHAHTQSALSFHRVRSQAKLRSLRMSTGTCLAGPSSTFSEEIRYFVSCSLFNQVS